MTGVVLSRETNMGIEASRGQASDRPSPRVAPRTSRRGRSAAQPPETKRKKNLERGPWEPRTALKSFSPFLSGGGAADRPMRLWRRTTSLAAGPRLAPG
jgi:hypothetical protein